MIWHIAEDAFDAKSYVSSVFRIGRRLASRQSPVASRELAS